MPRRTISWMAGAHRRRSSRGPVHRGDLPAGTVAAIPRQAGLSLREASLSSSVFPVRLPAFGRLEAELCRPWLDRGELFR